MPVDAAGNSNTAPCNTSQRTKRRKGLGA